MAQRYCRRCGEMVEDADYKSDNEYTYYCPNCDEDLYTFETYEELAKKAYETCAWEITSETED